MDTKSMGIFLPDLLNLNEELLVILLLLGLSPTTCKISFWHPGIFPPDDQTPTRELTGGQFSGFPTLSAT